MRYIFANSETEIQKLAVVGDLSPHEVTFLVSKVTFEKMKDQCIYESDLGYLVRDTILNLQTIAGSFAIHKLRTYKDILK